MRLFTILLTFFITFTIFAEELPDIKEITKKVDELFRSNSSYTMAEMRIETPDWKRALSMKIWTKGLDDTFVTILSPAKDKGISTLKKGAEMWNYFPKIDKTMKIPPSMMMSGWMGSDFTNDDMVKENSFQNDYESKFITGENKNSYYIELKPKTQTISIWGKIVVEIDKESYIPIKQEYYDEHDKKIRVFLFKEIKELGGKKIPTVIEIVPLTKEGYKTVFKYVEAKFDIELDESTFSLRNLQKKR
ncbi:outer membrane lipoprotein-sorting protein [bacterium]|nr:outer membrane lipoprotein-sorting protein [bacterium]